LAAAGAIRVLDVVEKFLPQMDAVSAATALNRIAKSSDGALAAMDIRFRILEECI